MGSFLYTILLIGFSFAPGSYSQGDVTGTTEGSNRLQPWLVGLAAVVGFLGVMFVGSLINRIFFSKKTNDKEEQRMDKNIELSCDPNIYDNLALEADDEKPSSEAKVEDEKQTTM